MFTYDVPIHSDPNNMNSIVYHLIIVKYSTKTLHRYFPWAIALHLYNMTGSSGKLQQLHCYHPFSDSLDIYLTKNHSENYSPKMVPIAKIWGSGSWTSRASINKIQKLRERALRFVLKDSTSDYETLMSRSDFDSFRISSIKTMAVEIYKILNGMSPEYLSSLFSKSNVLYQLRDSNKLIQPLKRTTTFGIKSLAYFGSHLWNMLPHHIKNSLSLCNFKSMIGKWSGPTCHCCVCTLVVWYHYHCYYVLISIYRSLSPQCIL